MKATRHAPSPVELVIRARKQAEAALLKTDTLQRAIFNSVNFSNIATDANGVIQIFNVGAERMLGYAAADVMNKITPAEISDPQELIARAQALSAELSTPITPGFEALVYKASRGIEDIYELTYIRKDGSRFPAVVSVTALREADKAIIGYLLIGTDNTARKQIETEEKLLAQRLRDQQFYTRSLIEANLDALMTTDPSGVISDVNKQMETLTGRTRAELIGTPFKDFFTDPDRAEAGIKLVLSRKKVSGYELTVRAVDGKETVVSYNATTFYDQAGGLQGVFAAARDITERKQAEATLARTAELLEVTGSLAKIGGWEVNLETMKLSWTRETFRIAELEPPVEPPLEQGINLFAPEARPTMTAAIQAAIATGTPYNLELPLITGKGCRRWVQTQGFAEMRNGKAVRLYGTFHDITERRQAEKQLQVKNLVFEASLAANSISDASGVIIEANSTFLETWGYPCKEEVVGRPISDFLQNQGEGAAVVTALTATGEWEGDYTAKRKDGSTFAAHALATVIRDEGGKVIGYQSSVEDITTRKQAEAALGASEENYHGLVDNLNMGLVIHGADTAIVLSNPMAASLLGLSADQLQGKTAIDPRWCFLRADGSPMPLAEYPVNRLFTSGEGFSGQVLGIACPERAETVWVTCSAYPEKSAQGRIVQAVVTFTDITARLQAETEVLRLHAELEQRVIERTAQLATANKELEAFSYSVSHDLRAPLRAIHGFARILKEDHAPRLDTEVVRLLNVISGEALRMGRLIDDLLKFSRLNRQALQQEWVSPSPLISLVLETLRAAQADRNIVVTVGELPPAQGDPALLSQVWTNLLANAFKFTGARPVAEIVVGGRRTDDEVIYSVQDNGAGFDMKYVGKLFGVFQRLHT